MNHIQPSRDQHCQVRDRLRRIGRICITFEGAGVHSIAVNASNGHIFFPVYGKGIFVVVPAK